jgi:hypothetical protein
MSQSPLNQTNGGLRVLGQNQQNVLGAKHGHCLLHGIPFVRSLEENRGNRICGDALAQTLEPLRGPDAVGNQHTAVASQKPANFC